MSETSEAPPWAKTQTLSRLPNDPEQADLRQFQLRLLKGELTGAHAQQKTVHSDGPRLSIGTHERVALAVSDRAVSRFHCEIELKGERAEIRDLGSTNGTFVDGVSVLHAHLRDGATIDVGRTRFRFQLGRGRVRVPLSRADHFGAMRGQSALMRNVFAHLEQAARSDATVLLSGETGTGKDLAAESIHRHSARAQGPFVVVDCAAIPDALVESALFGHVRGAFSGADRERAGAFETAVGGTLFLDEVGELPLEVQPKLLRAIEERAVQRVGATEFVKVDVRIVAASNRALRGEVNAGRFRSDLYYRLAVIEVTLPPLRERMEDLPLLVDAISAELIDDPHQLAALRAPEIVGRMAAHDWPGNLRELRNYLERCAVLGPGSDGAPLGRGSRSAASVGPDLSLALPEAREAWNLELEGRYVRQLLAHHGGNVSEAARAAGVDRRYFHRLLQRHQLR
jgi:DNA-binding NtrC family response regulator